jgi:hypothetical protein
MPVPAQTVLPGGLRDVHGNKVPVAALKPKVGN